MAAKEKVAGLGAVGASSVDLRFLGWMSPSRSSDMSPISKWVPVRVVFGKPVSSGLHGVALGWWLGSEVRTKETFLASAVGVGWGEGEGALLSWVPKVA